MEISEEVPLLEKPLVRRRMETKSEEIRRVHIVYFLSRMGKIEHPHLIRVHHVNRTGVRLRDVKRWLADLRGKDMPDSFSWSYKRRYKTGYVWQDLLDDDLITPVSDNEYVLKGSEISAVPSDNQSPADQCASAETTTTTQISDPMEDKTLQCTIVKDPESNSDSSDHNPNQTLMKKRNLVKRTVTFNLEPRVLEEEEEEEKRLESDPAKGNLKGSGKDSSFDASPFADHELKNLKGEKRRGSFFKTKGSNGASQVLRNILRCGAVDTNDSAMKMINPRSKVSTNSNREKKAEISKAEGVDGSEMVFSWTWNQQQLPHHARKSFNGMKNSRKKSAAVTQKPVLGSCKPMAEPNCSQCGKAFNPEKLHAHMKSCRAMKSRGKSEPQTSKDELTTEESAPAFLLTHSLK